MTGEVTPTTRQHWAATALGASAVLLVAAAVVLLIVSREDPFPPTAWFPRGANLPQVLVLSTMGWILARRRPDNPVGWLLLVGGWVAATQAVALESVVIAHAAGADGVGAWLALYVETAWPSLVIALVYAMARFPGEAGSDRAGALVAAAAVTSVTAVELFVAGPFQNVAWYDNPFGSLGGGAAAAMESAGFLPMLALMALTLVRLVRRYRGARGVPRQQVRWVAWSTVPLLLAMSSYTVTGDADAVSASDPGVLAVNLSILLLPAGIAVAVLRYRLYDLDRLLSRTVAWTLLTGIVVALWAAVALLPSALLGSDGSADQVLVAGATALAAAVFNPLRTRLQDAVDRRLHRERYDARREVEALGQRLADAVATAPLRDLVVETLARTLAPQTAAVWTPDDRQSR